MAVIGIGISNEPLIRLLCAEGIDVTACDKRSLDQLGMTAFELINKGAKLKLGDNYLDNLNYDIIFRTPSLLPFNDSLVEAANNGAIITSEMELFCQLCPCKIVAITGSDGKTTTTTIISELFKAAGYNVHLGGNIGKPLLCDVPFISKDDIAVVELSSFQLHSMKCSPYISVITNISPNHLDKHKDYDDYIEAKKQIFANQTEEGIFVVNADDEIVSKFPGNRYFSIEKKVDGAYLEDGKIYRNGKYLMDASNIKLPGLHNIKNYLTAFAATLDLVNDECCINVAKTFSGVEHRLETVRVYKGVTYINDSIGSSPSRTIAGLKSMKKKPIIILGGYDKKIPFDDLGVAVVEMAKSAIVTGDTAKQIISAIETAGNIVLYHIDDFDEAVKKSSEIAQDGDIVLFSPACASFDHFKNFEERGNHFKKIIMELNT